jgi:hypothetical protein
VEGNLCIQTGSRYEVIANTGYDRLKEFETELQYYRISKCEFHITSTSLMRVVINVSNI